RERLRPGSGRPPRRGGAGTVTTGSRRGRSDDRHRAAVSRLRVGRRDQAAAWLRRRSVTSTSARPMTTAMAPKIARSADSPPVKASPDPLDPEEAAAPLLTFGPSGG